MQSRAGATTMALDRTFSGDFDIASSLKIIRLAASDADQRPIELAVDLPGSGGALASLVVRRKDASMLQIVADISRTGDLGNLQRKEIGRAEAVQVDGLRLIRIQRTLFFLYAEDGIYRVLGQSSFGADEVKSGNVRFRMDASNVAETDNELLWKSFEVKASELDG